MKAECKSEDEESEDEEEGDKSPEHVAKHEDEDAEFWEVLNKQQQPHPG